MEVIYQRALEYEFRLEGLNYMRELEMDIYYNDLLKPIGNRRVDFLVEEKVLAETKALILLDDIHLAQSINYLEAFKLEVGLLINFGSKKLQFRIVMKSYEQLKKRLR